MIVDKKVNVQLLVTFPKGLIRDIENYWHENHLKSRSEAIRELVVKGLREFKHESYENY